MNYLIKFVGPIEQILVGNELHIPLIQSLIGTYSITLDAVSCRDNVDVYFKHQHLGTINNNTVESKIVNYTFDGDSEIILCFKNVLQSKSIIIVLKCKCVEGPFTKLSVQHLMNYRTHKGGMLYKGLLTPLMDKDADWRFNFPNISKITGCEVKLCLSELNLYFNETWTYTLDKTYSTENINSLEEVVEFLKQGLTLTQDGNKMIINNTTSHDCIFNQPFKDYCNLHKIKAGEQRDYCYYKREISVQDQGGEELFQVNKSIGLFDDYTYTYDLKDTLKITFYDNQADRLIRRQDIKNTSTIKLGLYCDQATPLLITAMIV